MAYIIAGGDDDDDGEHTRFGWLAMLRFAVAAAPTQVTVKKADRTNLRVILIANNPGSRTKIDCNGTRVRLFDVEYPYGQIGDVTLKNCTVPPRTTITLQKRLSNTNTSYIWEKYHLASRFSVGKRHSRPTCASRSPSA
ncbi:unnamed protein product [Miscanthus lutarioriparius]|uniref:Uncharacterized protein n=1 Tax=Miscanthus lutarioriparius TaxID=422564 RepID=A0A811RDL3_9POAL|nr:unnamed protein product [Miscanthus lutarioriparius]